MGYMKAHKDLREAYSQAYALRPDAKPVHRSRDKRQLDQPGRLKKHLAPSTLSDLDAKGSVDRHIEGVYE